MEIGGDPDRFWNLTPREVANEIKAAVAIQKRRRQELAWHAWHVAVLSRIDKIPPLEKFMGKPREHRERTWQEMAAEVQVWGKAINDNRGK